MLTPTNSILRAATRTGDEPLNILTASTHERGDTNLCKTGHNFWAIRTPQVKDWNEAFAPIPPNFVRLNPARGDKQLPPEVDFDLVLSQNRFGQFGLLANISRQLHLPLVTVEHTTVHPSWPPQYLTQLKTMRGHINVFITESSRKAWGWSEDEALVIHHGVDTDVFRPLDVPRKQHVFSAVNEFDSPERFWCCGYPFWREATEGLPYFHVGTSKTGFSKPAASVPDLVRHYNEAVVFIDTASASPIPTVVLEAMACSCIVVSRGNMAVPEVIQDGVNGFIRPTAEGMRSLLRDILGRPEAYEYVRANARRTILERFSLATFVASWEAVFQRAARLTYEGPP